MAVGTGGPSTGAASRTAIATAAAAVASPAPVIIHPVRRRGARPSAYLVLEPMPAAVDHILGRQSGISAASVCRSFIECLRVRMKLSFLRARLSREPTVPEEIPSTAATSSYPSWPSATSSSTSRFRPTAATTRWRAEVAAAGRPPTRPLCSRALDHRCGAHPCQRPIVAGLPAAVPGH